LTCPILGLIVFCMIATPFHTADLHKEGIYLTYGPKRQFVARFKHGGPVTMAKFKKELVCSHKVEDYFFDLNISRKAPLEILKEKNPSWYEGLKQAWMEKNA
jgi:hypothetical protein